MLVSVWIELLRLIEMKVCIGRYWWNLCLTGMWMIDRYWILLWLLRSLRKFWSLFSVNNRQKQGKLQLIWNAIIRAQSTRTENFIIAWQYLFNNLCICSWFHSSFWITPWSTTWCTSFTTSWWTTSTITAPIYIIIYDFSFFTSIIFIFILESPTTFMPPFCIQMFEQIVINFASRMIFFCFVNSSLCNGNKKDLVIK